MPYLSARALKGLKQYQYKPAGYTLLDDVHQPFWNWVTEQLPMWLSPNLITLSGICGLVVAYLVAAFYLPEFEGVAPWWVYFGSGAAGLVYLHLDCIDGKQARRTKSSSPLGQLFDHGCDALSVHLIIMAVASTLNLPISWVAVAGAHAVMIPWLLAHWEEYHSGIMQYGNGYWGVTEANYTLILLHFVTAALGAATWRHPVTPLLDRALPRLADWPAAYAATRDLQLNHALIAFLMVFCASSALGDIWRVFALEKGAIPAKERGHKALGRRAAAAHLAQLTLLMVLGAWMQLRMLAPPRSPGLARCVSAIFGVIYALEATKLIMDHMSKEPFQLIKWPIVVMAGLTANTYLHLVDSTFLSWVVLAGVVAGYLHYVTSVVAEVTEYLGINCLTIKQSRTSAHS